MLHLLLISPFKLLSNIQKEVIFVIMCFRLSTTNIETLFLLEPLFFFFFFSFVVGLVALEKYLQPSIANCFVQPQKLQRSMWVSHERSIFSCFTPKAAPVEGNSRYLIQTKIQEGLNLLSLAALL